MTTSNVQSSSSGYVPAPKSITNVIPLPVELTAVALMTLWFVVPVLGWVTAIGLSGGTVGITKKCLFDSRSAEAESKNAARAAGRSEIQHSEYIKTQKEKQSSASVVKSVAFGALCYKVADLALNIFLVECCQKCNPNAIPSSSLCDATVLTLSASAIGGIFSVGYAIKNMLG